MGDVDYGQASIEALFGDTFFNVTEKIRNGEEVTAELLASARRKYPDEEPPPEFVDYERRMIAGEIKKRRGRRPRQGGLHMLRQVLFIFAFEDAQRFHYWLRERKKRYGRDKWLPVNDPELLRASPLEVAIRLAMRKIQNPAHRIGAL